jgi:hypothetical protein
MSRKRGVTPSAWKPYCIFICRGPTALIRSSASGYGPNGASVSRRFWRFSNVVTSRLPAAKPYGESVTE